MHELASLRGAFHALMLLTYHVEPGGSRRLVPGKGHHALLGGVTELGHATVPAGIERHMRPGAGVFTRLMHFGLRVDECVAPRGTSSAFGHHNRNTETR